MTFSMQDDPEWVRFWSERPDFEPTTRPSERRSFCGFDDIRVVSGTYYCRACGKELGPDFRELVRTTLDRSYLTKLDQQCKEP